MLRETKMKLVAGALAAVCLMLAAPPSEARGFKKGRRLPRPIDYPIVRKNTREDHKTLKRGGYHPLQNTSWTWGRLKRQTYDIPPSHFGLHVFYDRYE
jgi:hypothetical protein